MVSKRLNKNGISDFNFMNIISNILLWISVLIFLFPFYWMLTSSFKTQSVAVQIPPDLFPLNPVFRNYIRIFSQSMIPKWFLNSMIVALVGTALVVITASMAGYALAKKKFAGRNVLFWIIISTMMIPNNLLIVPLFLIIRDLHLYNTLPAVFLPIVGWPFSVFLLKQFSQTLPDEIFDAGKIDGCSEAGLFVHIGLPMIKPGIGAVAIFMFTQLWNDFLWPLVIVTKSSNLTLMVGLAALKEEYVMQGGGQFGIQMAASVLAALPMVIIFLIFQRFFIKGLTLGAVKG